MSFGGPIDSMIKTHKSNLRLLRGRKRWKEIEAAYPSKPGKAIDIQVADEPRQVEFQRRIKRFRREAGRRTLLIVVVTVILAMIILLWLVSLDYTAIIETIAPGG